MVTARRAESTGRVIYEMVMPTVRTLACVPAALSVFVAVATIAYAEIRYPHLPAYGEILRFSTVTLAMGVGFAFDDAASETLSAVPFALLRRRSVRVGMALGIVAPAWAAMLLYARERGGSVPAVDLTVELVALTALALMAASVMIRMGRSTPGTFVAPAVLIFRQLSTSIPVRWGLWGGEPGSDIWMQSHRRWAGLAILAIVGVAWLSHDPARKKLFHRKATTR